ncbi:related to ketoreductases [Fusarium torulosum]|jgi:NAD(P)-dependent dehydrogenase (short-subunit alcohol dehydrogenase family)|uniref:Related to ketoreductases n=1 Tax=Fusarium torulosum TaxID=33205 RepID=A0AAE8MIZ4_9HYPO|nr:related to ketoreductases [Fusarium torulosum]
MARVWFVTGSSRGLGRALVEQVLASGDIVVATARKPSQLDDLVTKYGSEKIFATALDVTDANQANLVVKEAVNKFGRIDVLVNNAGYADLASVEDMSLESFRAQVDVNLYGVVNVTKAAVPILRQQKSGHIIQVSTIGDRVGTPGAAAYQSAKWAVAGFSTVLAQELAPFGIKVTVAEPGGIKTDWAAIATESSNISEPYKQTVGMMFKLMEDKSTWDEGSDIARALVHLSQVEEPPLRIVLGPSALPWSQMAAKALADSDEKWMKVSRLEF